MKQVTLCGRAVRVDEKGLICLTDMWKASGAEAKKKPIEFLRLEQTENFVSALNSKVGYPTLRKVRGGNAPGTWGHKLLAYKFASWIDPEFEIGVYTVLDKFFEGELVKKPQHELHEFLLRAKLSEQLGSFYGKGLAKRRVEKHSLETEEHKLLEKYQLTLLTH